MHLQTVLLKALFLVFVAATVVLTLYGLHLYVLLGLFLRKWRARREAQRNTIAEYGSQRAAHDWPLVTTQIPIYNEADVAERVMRAVAAMSYPYGRHEIQILDDSTDHTRNCIDRTAAELLSAGADVKVIRREYRAGYKAGALAHGLRSARGTFVAVFDADFVPPADFLVRAIPLIATTEDVACIQGRWDHLNRDESWLTRAQALGLDAHFAIEQGARAWNGLMMNFNGTAGIWRKEAIDDPRVGGWNGDTLTEDMDLSYRAQLAGWRMDYCLEIACPAELPNTIPALKGQQRRWATGSIQVARKLLGRIWRSPVSWGAKCEATLHLTNHTVAIWLLLLAILAKPMLLVFSAEGVVPGWMAPLWIAILIAALAPSLAYAAARYIVGGRLSGFRGIPGMFLLGSGLCLSNALAVLRGFLARSAEFVRTPKSGSVTNVRRHSSYRASREYLWIAELFLGAYSLTSFVVYLGMHNVLYSLFLLLYAVGFLTIGWMSRPRPTGSQPLPLGQLAHPSKLAADHPTTASSVVSQLPAAS